ncbi:MAG: phosphatidate cytidylyltransferase [Lachnospiraceae bacterium]|nr:phosphatidate cytidylyltransferase [Lachnospiraceae bacterium]
MIKKLFTKATLVRTLSSVLLVAVALFTLIMGENILLATMLAVSLLGQFELYRVISMQKRLPGISGYAAAIVYYLLLLLQKQEYVMVVVIAYLMLLMAEYVFSFPKYRTEEICLVYLGFFYVPVMMSFVYQIRELQNGTCLVFLVFLSSWICDTCAYLVGVTLGKHKLAPKLSPHKSVEGSIGGIAGSVLLGALYGWLFSNYLGDAFTNPAVGCAIVCGLGAVISQVGDLAASGIKRNYDVKDYGHLIPGHGGILDRFDSVIFVAPAIYFLVLLIN